MAGKMRFAAKCLLGLTLLASGGGGVYYAKTHDWTLPALSHGETKPAASDLDAVASAWTEPVSKHAAAGTLSSPIARSAIAEPTPADEPLLKPTADTRYGSSLDPSATPLVAKDDTSKNKKAHQKPAPGRQSKKAKEPDPVALASHGETKSGGDPTSATKAVPAHEAALARGQEPTDETPLAVPVKASSANIGGASDTVGTTGKPIPEPKPLTAPDQQTSITEAARRAKQAFGSSTPPTPGDRYGNAAPPATEPAAPPKGVTVNPFGSKPTSPSVADSKSTSIEPLPPAPNDLGGPLRDVQQNGGTLRPLDSNGMTRVATRDTASKQRGVQAIPSGSAPTPISVRCRRRTAPCCQALEISPANRPRPVRARASLAKRRWKAPSSRRL